MVRLRRMPRADISCLAILLFCLLAGTYARADMAAHDAGAIATPYDSKLSSAGFFNHSATLGENSPLQHRSIASLFYEARSFRYVPDFNGDYWQSPDETASKRSGDCEDKALWLYQQLVDNGYTDVQLVIGKFRQHEFKNHVWVTCSDPSSDNTLLLDPSSQKRPWVVGSFSDGFYITWYVYNESSRVSRKNI